MKGRNTNTTAKYMLDYVLCNGALRQIHLDQDSALESELTLHFSANLGVKKNPGKNGLNKSRNREIS